MEKPQAIKLKKVLRSNAITALLEKIEREGNLTVWILDHTGNVVHGKNFPGLDKLVTYPIVVNEAQIGSVAGNRASDVVADLLNLIGNYELEQRNILGETLERYKELTLLYNLGEKLTLHLEVKPVAELVVSEALNHIRGDDASIMLFNPVRERLEVIASMNNYNEERKHITLLPGQGIAGHVFQSGQPEIVNAVQADDRFVPGYTHIEAIMCAPLKVKGHIIGVINISSATPIQYSAAELKLFNAIALPSAYALENSQLHMHKVREDRIKNNLQRYVSSQLVDAIIKSEDDKAFEPQSKNITTLFSDIRNFTPACESLPPEKMVNYLNRYFSEMVDIIFKYNGTINKFVGDMIVALFGAPYDLENDARLAVQAAIEMQNGLANLSDEWIRNNFLTGIGINKGDVVVGNIGSHHHMDYTAIGDAVNVASRLQALAKGRQILVTDTIYNETKELFDYRKFDQVIHLKGRKKPVQIFEVLY